MSWITRKFNGCKWIWFPLTLVLLASNAYALEDLYATTANVYSGGVPLAWGNASFKLSHDGCTTFFYDSGNDFNGSIVQGQVDVMLGNESLTVLKFDPTERYAYLWTAVQGVPQVWNSTGGSCRGFSNPFYMDNSTIDQRIEVFNATLTSLNPAGVNGSVQFNNNGAFNGSSNLTWNESYKQLTITGNGTYGDVLVVNGTYGTTNFTGNDIRFTRPAPNYITATNALGSLLFGAGGVSGGIYMAISTLANTIYTDSVGVGIKRTNPRVALDVTGAVNVSKNVTALEYCFFTGNCFSEANISSGWNYTQINESFLSINGSNANQNINVSPYWLQSEGLYANTNATIKQTLAVGSLASPASNAVVYAWEEFNTDYSNTVLTATLNQLAVITSPNYPRALSFELNYEGNGVEAYRMAGINGVARTKAGSTNVNGIRGAVLTVEHDSTASIFNAIGVRGAIAITNGGNITGGANIWGSNDAITNGTISTLVGVGTQAPVVTAGLGHIGTYFGIYAPPVVASSDIDNAYGFYSQGSNTPNWFAGNTSFGKNVTVADNVTAESFNGLFNWTCANDYCSFTGSSLTINASKFGGASGGEVYNGTFNSTSGNYVYNDTDFNITFNETYLNNTIDARASGSTTRKLSVTYNTVLREQASTIYSQVEAVNITVQDARTAGWWTPLYVPRTVNYSLVNTDGMFGVYYEFNITGVDQDFNPYYEYKSGLIGAGGNVAFESVKAFAIVYNHTLNMSTVGGLFPFVVVDIGRGNWIGLPNYPLVQVYKIVGNNGASVQENIIYNTTYGKVYFNNTWTGTDYTYWYES